MFFYLGETRFVWLNHDVGVCVVARGIQVNTLRGTSMVLEQALG